jgi:hypothetical protein
VTAAGSGRLPGRGRTALVGADRYALRVFLEHRVDDLVHRAVVTEVDDSAPCDCRIRRLILIAASCPSNSAVDVTKRTGFTGTCSSLLVPAAAAATPPRSAADRQP